MADQREIVIATHDLTKRYGDKTAVDSLNLSIGRRQVFAFLGENGAGKTTTIRLLLGLHRPSRGGVLLFGQPLSTQRAALLGRIGTLIEAPSYYGHLTGRENVEIIARLRGLPPRAADATLERVGLASHARQRSDSFSQGMRQRLGIAMALLGDPELLILDEPTNSLDPSGIREMRQLIASLPADRQMTVFVSSHLLNEVELMATHVGIIHQGRLLFQGPLPELRTLAQPEVVIKTNQQERARALLNAQGFSAVEQEAVLVVATDQERIAQINQILVGADIQVLHLTNRAPTLEEVYFSLTGAQQRPA